MQSIRWVGFGVANALTRTVVHFLASEGSVTAPHEINCSLRIFGHSLNERKITVEGGRISHPNGFRLEDAFESLKNEQVGIFGVEVELMTNQPRVDLGYSWCIFELASKGHSARYWPKRLVNSHVVNSQNVVTHSTSIQAGGAPFGTGIGALIKDPFTATSVIVVNGEKSGYEPTLVCGAASDRRSQVVHHLPISATPALAAVEQPIDEAFFAELPVIESSWGLLRCTSLTLEDGSSSFSGRSLIEEEQHSFGTSPSQPDSLNATLPRGVFLLYRDALTRRPVSVVSL
jgi:hypothetical protein